ncbi:MAG TPA: DinB family protein [Gemmatimonadaceae bacterium]|nr:DinB family protein [Gemmatimonadaceae bacterium]
MTMYSKSKAGGNGASPEKQRFLDAFATEHARTMRVARAYPPDRLDLTPHERSQSARALLWLFAGEQGLMARALTDWSKPYQRAPAPDDLATILETIEQSYQRVVALLDEATDAQLQKTLQFPVGPQQLGDWRTIDFLWFMLYDQIHHRGQLSVYLRMAGGKVPGIYGPSADEPWR